MFDEEIVRINVPVEERVSWRTDDLDFVGMRCTA